MSVRQEWHCVDQSTGAVTVFDHQHLAMQHIGQQPAGTIVALEQHTTVISLLNVYGTAQVPLPPAPPNPVPTMSQQVTHTHIHPQLG